MSILACSGFEEGDGANFTPPTMGEFMKRDKQLREARAGAAVIREARLFHEHNAMKHGIHTKRGNAHMKAARMFSREAGMSLQEKLESLDTEMGKLDPKAIARASKDSIKFHQKAAQKAGLDTDLGHAHAAAMEHHMDRLNALKGGEQLSNEKPPQPQKNPNPKQPVPKPPQPQPQKRMQAAASGKSGKGLPVPVPKKSDMPNGDIRQNKPPINLDAQQGDSRKLQQKEGGPGSGPHKGSNWGISLQHKSDSKRSFPNYHTFGTKQAARSKAARMQREHPAFKVSINPVENKHSNEAARQAFQREALRGPYGKSRVFPKTNPLKQIKSEIIDRGPMPKRESVSRRHL